MLFMDFCYDIIHFTTRSLFLLSGAVQSSLINGDPIWTYFIQPFLSCVTSHSSVLKGLVYFLGHTKDFVESPWSHLNSRGIAKSLYTVAGGTAKGVHMVVQPRVSTSGYSQECPHGGTAKSVYIGVSTLGYSQEPICNTINYSICIIIYYGDTAKSPHEDNNHEFLCGDATKTLHGDATKTAWGCNQDSAWGCNQEPTCMRMQPRLHGDATKTLHGDATKSRPAWGCNQDCVGMLDVSCVLVQEYLRL